MVSKLDTDVSDALFHCAKDSANDLIENIPMNLFGSLTEKEREKFVLRKN